MRLAQDEVLSSKSERARAIHAAFDAVVRACGDVRVHPQKTRIAYIAQMTFASIRLGRAHADLSLVLDGPVCDERVRAIDAYGPTSFAHELRVTAPEHIDDDVRTWIERASRRGRRETLERAGPVPPVAPPALDVLRVPLRSAVVDREGHLACRVPVWTAQALGLCHLVQAKVGRHDRLGTLRHGERRVTFEPGTLEALGLGAGDTTDLFLRAGDL